MAGNHLRLNQRGEGDAVISWDVTANNANRRWYAGIDYSDGYSWKLANPEASLAYGQESFDNPAETKLKIAANGDTNIAGKLTIGGNTLATLSPTFSLANDTAVIVNAFQAATTLSMGSNANNATVTLRGTTQSNSTNSGALVVGGGVGVAGNLYVGGHLTNTTIIGTLSATGDTTLGGKLSLASDATFGNNLSVAGIGTFGNNLSIGGDIAVAGDGDIISDVFVGKVIKKNPGDPTNFLRANGSDSILSNQDFINSLGFVPGPPITVTTYPIGNSILLDPISQNFDGTTLQFNLTRDGGTPFVPVGPVNLIVSIGGVVQRANTDYFIQSDPVTGDYTNIIRFTTAPTSGLSEFIVALGGQGALLSNIDWEKKGEIPVGIRDNTAVMQQVGADGTVLTAESSSQTGVAWKPIPPAVLVGSVFNFAGSVAPDGYLVCDGSTVPNGTGTVQGKTADFSTLYAMLGTTYGSAGQIPNLLGKFSVGSGGGYSLGAQGGANTVTLSSNEMPSHTHTGNSGSAGGHGHSASASNNGNHGHSGSASSAGNHGHSGSSSPSGYHGHSGSASPVGNHNHNYQRPNTNNTPKQPGGGPEANRGSSGDGTGGGGAHGHSVSINGNGAHNHSIYMNSAGNHSHPISINSAGDHSHPVSVTSGGDHSHPISIQSTGGSGAHENRPPYVALLPVIKF